MEPQRVAIPLFDGEVAPRFCFARWMLLAEIEDGTVEEPTLQQPPAGRDARVHTRLGSPRDSGRRDGTPPDAFVVTGLELELWAPKLIDKSMNGSIRQGQKGYIAVYSGMKLLGSGTLTRLTAVVSFYGVVLLLVALILYVIRSQSPLRALGHVALGVVVLVLVVGYFHGLRSLINAVPGWRRGEHHQAHALAPNQARKRTAVSRFDDLDLEAKGKAVTKMKDLAKLKRFYVQATTPGARLKLAERVAQIDRREGAKLLVSVLVSDAPIFFRNTALERLGKMCGRPFDVDLMDDDEPKVKRVIIEVKRCVHTLVARTATPPAPPPRPKSAPDAAAIPR